MISLENAKYPLSCSGDHGGAQSVLLSKSLCYPSFGVCLDGNLKSCKFVAVLGCLAYLLFFEALWA